MTDTAFTEKSAQLRDGRTVAILRPAEITPRARVGGARTIPMVSRQVGAKVFLNGITAFPPGAAIPEHFHNCDESVLIIRGSAVAHIDGQTYPVGSATPRSSPPVSRTSSRTPLTPKNSTFSGPTPPSTLTAPSWPPVSPPASTKNTAPTLSRRTNTTH